MMRRFCRLALLLNALSCTHVKTSVNAPQLQHCLQDAMFCAHRQMDAEMALCSMAFSASKYLRKANWPLYKNKNATVVPLLQQRKTQS